MQPSHEGWLPCSHGVPIPRNGILLITLLLLVALCGCGSGGGSGSSTTTTVVTTDVLWPTRSRALSATSPNSALSVVVTIPGANPDGTNFSWTINRDTNLESHTTSYTSPTVVKAGTWPLQASFYAQSNGQGSVVATASTTVTLNTNGNSIGTITPVGTVASVIVDANQSLAVGQTADLSFTARDAQGNLLALTAGSAFFQVANGASILQLTNQQAVGLAPGTASLIVTVDNVTSPSQTVTVTAPATISVAVSPNAASPTVGGTVTFTATITGTTDQSVTWSVQEGASGGAITANGVYTAPSTPGTYHVTATSVADTTKSATVTVTVQATPASSGSSTVTLQ